MAMNERLENLLVRLLHGAVIAITAWSVLTIDFTGRGRLIDRLRGVEKGAVADAELSAPQKAKLNGAGSQDRVMAVAGDLGSEQAAERRGAMSAAELAAQVPDVASALGKPKRLSTKLASLDDPSRMASQQTSAMAAPAPAYVEAAAVAAPAPAGTSYSIEPPSADEPQRRAVASRYGSGRGDMMGRAAGPVYNIKKK